MSPFDWFLFDRFFCLLNLFHRSSLELLLLLLKELLFPARFAAPYVGLGLLRTILYGNFVAWSRDSCWRMLRRRNLAFYRMFWTRLLILASLWIDVLFLTFAMSLMHGKSLSFRAWGRHLDGDHMLTLLIWLDHVTCSSINHLEKRLIVLFEDCWRAPFGLIHLLGTNISMTLRGILLFVRPYHAIQLLVYFRCSSLSATFLSGSMLGSWL